MISPFGSACEMVAALRARTVSAAELLELHIARIEQFDGPINAVVVRDFERARAAARAADEQLSANASGALLGLPMTIKESINISGLPTCCGITDAREFVSAHDAPTTVRLKSAGAVLMGKTNVPVELSDWQSSNPVYGRTANPYNLQRSPGGSSGGSAAALASGMTPLEVGSDIGGSIRVPAAFCGVFGHRPSETALAKSGQFPVPPTPIPAAVLGVQGPLARTAADLRLAMQVLGGADIGEDRAWQLHLPAARHESLRDFRVAVLQTPDWVPLAPAVRAAQHACVRALREHGCDVQVDQPEGFDDWRAHNTLYNQLLGAMLGARTTKESREERCRLLEQAGDNTSVTVCEGMRADVPQLFQWLAHREQVRAAWRSFFTRFDVFVAPAVMRNAYEHLALEGAPFISSRSEMITVDGKQVPYSAQLFFPAITILAGQPATAFPMGFDEQGLPNGLQVVGPYLEDFTTIRFLELLEAQQVIGFTPPANYQ